MEWTVVTVIIALVGLFSVVIPPSTKLTKAMTELTDEIKHLSLDLNKLESKNNEDHKELWEHNDKQDERIENHEQRIIILEHDDAKTSKK